MAKTPEDELVKRIQDDFHTYLRKGVRVDRVVGSAHPELEIDDIESLLRIHFVLTDAEENNDPEAVGVLDFMRRLEDRIRRMKTTTTPESIELRGEVRGHIDWQQTVKQRLRVGRLDEPVFVCNQPEEHYDIDENLVLKRLLSIIREIVYEDLQPALDDPDGYQWLTPWLDPPASARGRDPESMAERLKRIYDRNVYLQRIDVADATVTDRTIESVKRSRSEFYHEAAVLLDRYRQLMNHQLDSAEARDILNNTIIAPEKPEVLFELYWVFRILESYDAVEYRVLTDWGESKSTVATWNQDDSQFRLSHDATGDGLLFAESLGEESVEPDGYLYRMSEVLDRWQSLAESVLDRGGEDSLWGGRPDIVLERYERDEADGWTLKEAFIGEVKYSRDINYIASGLRELLEYMAFVRRRSNQEYMEKDPDDVLSSASVKGLLFVDDLKQDTESPDKIDVIQYPGPDSIDRVL